GPGPGMNGMPGMQPGMPGGPPPPSFPPGMQPGGPAPNKTVMLQPSEGVVSVAMSGQQQVQPAGMSPSQSMGMPGPGPGAVQGASTLFWIVSLVIGVAVGALAYVVVLQL
ncbi:MAG TPA: hypothetical protein VFP84_08535, partial [Kofleriaceae bacterium]|nr:hypothetical protein [Kofleriaceae bacterium]